MLTNSLLAFGLQEKTIRKNMVESMVNEIFLIFMISQFASGFCMQYLT